MNDLGEVRMKMVVQSGMEVPAGFFSFFSFFSSLSSSRSSFIFFFRKSILDVRVCYGCQIWASEGE